MAKYNVNYNGTRYSENNMADLAARIARTAHKRPGEVYEALTGRHMTDAQATRELVKKVRYEQALRDGFVSWRDQE